jgi:hypothetical protein
MNYPRIGRTPKTAKETLFSQRDIPLGDVGLWNFVVIPCLLQNEVEGKLPCTGK